jgi:hypothetical protein
MSRKPAIASDRVERMIHIVRGQKVMLDSDLAALYGVSTKALKQAVRRNRNRFPEDFMFEFTADETQAILRSQFVTLRHGQHSKYAPYAFTEQGVAMLSSVLKSPRAIQVNIEIMRAFVKVRGMLAAHADLALKLEALENRYDAQFKVVFDAIRELMATPPDPPQGRIGFHRS